MSAIQNLQPLVAIPNDKNVFISIGGGYSWTNNADISADTSFWDPAPQGYNGSIGNSSILNAEVGYIVNPLFSFGFGASYRGDYSYSRFQASSSASTAGAGANKTRFFDLDNTSIMADLYFNKFGNQNYFNYCIIPHTYIHPFIGAGIGVAYNHMSNFHSVLANGTNPAEVSAVETDYTRKSFAYEAMTGLMLVLSHTVSIDGGYRYFNGGKFQSNTFVASQANGSPLEGPAWTGKLTANEVFAEINFSI